MAPQGPKVLYNHLTYKGPRVRKKKPGGLRRPELTIDQILKWADDYHEETGNWPTAKMGKVGRFVDETWLAIDMALRVGVRNLPGGSSLAKLLWKHRGVTNNKTLPQFTPNLILAWADEHFQRTGNWPTRSSGPISASPGNTWSCVQSALVAGSRGLSSGSSLARLLAEHRSVRNEKSLPTLNQETVLLWADAHFQRTGEWPTRVSGPIAEAQGETWFAVDTALHRGRRGLPCGSSLASLLFEYHNVRYQEKLPRLTTQLILSWADAYHASTGQWPSKASGMIPDSDGETWWAVDAALNRGVRGQKGNSSIARLLATHRNVRNPQALPRLTPEIILSWADFHKQRTGKWPLITSGKIEETNGENWKAVDGALRKGKRGLPGGSSLACLLAKYRSVRNHMALQPLTTNLILTWADDHFQRYEEWPTSDSGIIDVAPNETWLGVDAALRSGSRGLPSGSSLARLLCQLRKVRNRRAPPRLSTQLILSWIDTHFVQTGRWPTSQSGPLINAEGERWGNINQALLAGTRGLPGGSSLAKLLNEHRRNKPGS